MPRCLLDEIGKPDRRSQAGAPSSRNENRESTLDARERRRSLVRYSDLVSKITGYEMHCIGSLCDDLTRKYVINRWHRSSDNSKPVLNTLEITSKR
ncbi:hypothetical protein V1478_002845 [Vespula squamosa]|uniref:Uncharacterized protein n=1 Tax=Vespula squamosa TaxID=30214 RepID=A0ABD2BRJ4_VESSQ